MGKLLNVKKNTIIAQKPSATIAVRIDINALQRKIYDVLLYVVKHNLKEEKGRKKFSLKLSEIKDFLEMRDKKNTYVKARIKEMMTRIAEYNVLGKDKDIEGAFPLLSWVEFTTDKKTQEVILNFQMPDIVLESLVNKTMYANIKLVVIAGLQSKYAVILYELIMDYVKNGSEIPVMSMEEFRKIFGLYVKDESGKEKEKYSAIKDLKKRVLEPATKEINNSNEIDFIATYELKRVGKRYEYIKFHVKPKPAQLKLQQQADSLVEQEVKENTDLKELLSLIPNEQRTERLASVVLAGLESKGFDYTKAQVEYCVEALKRSDIANFSGYVKSAIEEDYAGVKKVEIDDNHDIEDDLKIISDKYIGLKYVDVDGISVIKNIQKEKEQDIIIVTFEKNETKHQIFFETIENLTAWLRSQERFRFHG